MNASLHNPQRRWSLAASLGAHLALVATLAAVRAPERVIGRGPESTVVLVAAPLRAPAAAPLRAAARPRPAPADATRPAAAELRRLAPPARGSVSLPEPEPPPETTAPRLPAVALVPEAAVPAAPPAFGAYTAAAPAREPFAGRAGTATPGFGAAVSAPATFGRAPEARTSGFGAARAKAVAAAAPAPVTPQHRPAAILMKPRPRYTAAALARRIEGEVWLEVLFPAAGAARALRVVRGLGFGLDEEAMACVAELSFRPAEQDGRAVDSAAVVRLRFELAEVPPPGGPASAHAAERRSP